MKILIIGGAGTVGSFATKFIHSTGLADEIVIGDINFERAEALAKELGGNVSALKIDVSDRDSLMKVAKGFDVVLNTAGPFYKYGPLVLDAVIEAGVNYVDICDDYDATIRQLDLHEKAVSKGVSALIGMGSSPGIANVLVKFAADYLLDEAESVGIYHLHGGEEYEGPAVIKHRIHAMLSDVPVYIDGEWKTVKMLEESGRALEEDVEFCGLGTYRCYIYPHPEIITLPRFIKSLKKVVNLGTVLPEKYFKLIMDFVRLGVVDEEPIRVGDVEVKPIDFAVSYILNKRPKLLKEAGLERPVGCLKIVVEGLKGGERVKYVFEGVSGGGMGEGTAIPAAFGALYMGLDKIDKKGVYPPEGCIEPKGFIEFIKKFFTAMGEELPIRAYKIDSSGRREEIRI